MRGVVVIDTKVEIVVGHQVISLGRICFSIRHFCLGAMTLVPQPLVLCGAIQAFPEPAGSCWTSESLHFPAGRRDQTLKLAADFLVAAESLPKHPYWPNGNSGITIGVGWDLGYHS